jgi:hypothetical protein
MGRSRLPNQAAMMNAALSFCRTRAKQFVVSGHSAIAADYIIRGLSYRQKDRELLQLGAAVGDAVGQPDLKATCERALSALGATRELADMPQKNSELLTISAAGIDEVNAVIAESQAGHLVRCEHMAGYGRGIVASVDIAKDEFILAERPLFAQRRSASYCAQCLAPLKQQSTVPCGNNTCAETYCSVDCRAQAHEEGHAHVCSSPAYRELTSSLAADIVSESRGNASVALSMLVAVQMAVRGAATQQHPLAQEGVAELSGAITYEPAQTLDSTGALTVQIADALVQPHFFLEDLMTLFAKVQTNEFVSPAGTCVFRVLSMLNHSCVPNAAVEYDDEGHAILKTVATVARGQQVLIDYTAGYGAKLSHARRQSLLSQRHFDCFCSRCVRKM